MSNAPHSLTRDRIRQELDEREVRDALLHPEDHPDWVEETLNNR